MKKIFFFILSVCIFSGVLLIGSEKSYAETGWWGDPNSKWVTQINDVTKPNFNVADDTVQLTFSPTHTVYSTKEKSFTNAEIGAQGQGVVLQYGESLKVTHAGRRNGQAVDLQITNFNDGGSDAILTVMPNGRIDSYVHSKQINNYSHLVRPKKQFFMKLLDNSTGEIIRNCPILFTQTQYNPMTNSSYVYGFNTSNFRRFYALKNASLAESLIYYDQGQNQRVIIEDIGGQRFDYAYYGQTDYNGNVELYGATMYENIYMNYNIYNPDTSVLVYPSNYSNTTSTVEEKTTEDGKYITISTQQPMVKQSQSNFYPAYGSFKLDLNESNIDYLEITENDFTVSTEAGVMNKSEYDLVITRNSASKAVIHFSFKNYFGDRHAGKTVTIDQTSMIKPDEAILNSKLNGPELPIKIGTELNYRLNQGVQNNLNKKIITNAEDYEFEVDPTLTANVTENYVTSMTNVKDIPIDELVKEEKNTYFPWDIVTASYSSPEQPLTAGENTVNISLKSGTFTTTKKIEAKVSVEEGYELTYNGNGGKVNGKDTEVVNFTKNGIKLLDSAAAVREGYDFIGWSTSQTENVSQFALDYIYGLLPPEQTNTVLYACWKLQLTLTTSWQKDQLQPNLTTKVDRSETATTLNFYWKANIEDTRFLISMKQGNKTTELKKIQQKGPGSAYKEDTLEIDTKDLSYGDNELVIEFFELNDKGELIDGNAPKSRLNLTITVLGSLSFKSAPENLLWTQRKSADSIGTMDRDANNTMDISVVDSREIKSEDWSVQASLTYLDPSVPFDFVWKKNSKDKGTFMSTEAVTVMNKKNSTEVTPYHYSQTWKEDAGVLLHSDQKVAEGDYSKKVVVNWVLSLTP